MKLLKLLFLILLSIYASSVFSTDLFDNSFFEENYLIKKQLIFYYQDSTGNLSDEEIINQNSLFKRHYVEENTNIVSNAKTTLWLRVTIDSNYKENLVIKFLPYFKNITTYYYDKDSVLIKQQHHHNDKFSPKKYFSHSIILEFPPSSVKAYYIKFSFYDTFLFGVFELNTYMQFYNLSFNENIYYSFLLSSICIIAIFAIFYALINKEIANIYYSLYAIFFGTFVISSYNLWPYFTSSTTTYYHLRYYYVPFSLSTIFFALYILKTLGNKSQFYKTYLLVCILLVIKSLTVIFVCIAEISFSLEQILNKTDVVVFCILLFYASCQVLTKSYKGNWWVLVGLTVLFIAQFLHIFYNYSHWIFNIMYFEVLWFGVGISINYRKAKQEIISVLQETIAFKTNYNSQLELEVKERTLQLETNLQTIAHLNNILEENNLNLESNIATLEQDRVLNKEMSLNEFKLLFDTSNECMDLLMELKWKEGFTCNICESKTCLQINPSAPYVRRCKECKKAHSATSDTLFHSLKFPLEKAFYILFLSASSKKYSVQQISDLIDLRVATVWNFKKKIEEKMETIKFHKKNNLTWQDLIL